jgi:hypothetical protein
MDIVDYIKKNYPKIVFEPVQFEKSLTRALGFIVTENKLVIGFINSNGKMCKLIEPIDLDKLSNENFMNIVNNLPVLKGFTEKDKTRIVRIFSNTVTTISKDEHENIVEDLKRRLAQLELNLKTKQDEYNIFYDSQSDKIVLIEKEYEEKLNQIKQQYQDALLQIEKYKSQIVDQNQMIVDGINKYKEEVKGYIEGKDLQMLDLQKLYDKGVEERGELENRLESLLKNEKQCLGDIEKNKDVISECDLKITKKQEEISILNQSITVITEELSKLKEELSKSEMKAILLQGYRQRCKEKVLNEKDQIIQSIQDYNKKWLDWSENVKSDVNDYKRKMLSELITAQDALKSVLEDAKMRSSSEKEIQQLKQNIVDIENALKQTISEQLSELSSKEERIKFLEQERLDLERKNEELENTCSDAKGRLNSDIKRQSDTIKQRDLQISELQSELERVRSLLQQNNNTRVEVQVDYDNCYNIVKNFIALNNIFYRKMEIVQKLDNIIKNNIQIFTHLNESIKRSIAEKFEKVRIEISNHINFLNLAEYINSPNVQYLKSKSTREYVPPTFCNELVNLIDYWNVNKLKYREQDRILTNIYEDLSGAVRVYIRIKPMIGVEQKMNTVSIETIENKKQKLLTIDCTEKTVDQDEKSGKKTFGEFYGIFDDTFTNLDVYTGQSNSAEFNKTKTKVDLDSLVESSDTISPGVYNSFKQVEDGYSIVIFGYGLSGSGKTMTLLGSKGIPGLLHYGLDNLQNVSNIRLKYLFEQYYSLININFNKVTGKIHNLINKVPQLKEFSKDETEIFAKRIPSYINVDNLKVEDIYSLTDIIDNYRKEVGRIRATPNNPASSRSHLYFVFEITFANGKTGFISIVDTAGRESPLDIFNTFIDTSKTKLASIMAPPPVGGEGKIADTMRSDLKDSYLPKDIFEILKQGFYINETINHLIYYFNEKNYRQHKVVLQVQDTEKYNPLKYYIRPQDEEKSINSNNNCLMIPILKFLDTLTNKNKQEVDWRPTKFITICTVRQEEKYCDQTFETLQFAQSIKST